MNTGKPYSSTNITFAELLLISTDGKGLMLHTLISLIIKVIIVLLFVVGRSSLNGLAENAHFLNFVFDLQSV